MATYIPFSPFSFFSKVDCNVAISSHGYGEGHESRNGGFGVDKSDLSDVLPNWSDPEPGCLGLPQFSDGKTYDGDCTLKRTRYDTMVYADKRSELRKYALGIAGLARKRLTQKQRADKLARQVNRSGLSQVDDPDRIYYPYVDGHVRFSWLANFKHKRSADPIQVRRFRRVLGSGVYAPTPARVVVYGPANARPNDVRLPTPTRWCYQYQPVLRSTGECRVKLSLNTGFFKSVYARLDVCEMVEEVVPQSGFVEAKYERHISRAERDEQQRRIALDKAKRAYKAKPKGDRKDEIKRQRDKRNVVMQSGKFVTAIAAVGATLFLQKAMSLFQKGTHKVADAVSEFSQQLKSFKACLIKNVGKAFWLAPFLMVAHYALSHFKVQPILRTALLVVIANTVGNGWDHFANFFQQGETGPQIQSGGASILSKLLATIMAFSVFGGKPSPFRVSEFCKRIGSLDRMASGWDAFIGWVISAMESIVNYVRSHFGKDRVTFFRGVHKPTYEWAASVDSLCKLDSIGKLEADVATLSRMQKAIVDGFGFKEVYRGTAMEKMVSEYLARATALMAPYLGAVSSNNNFRAEPVACVLQGNPGIGKTRLAVPFCAAILVISGLVQNSGDEAIRNIWQKGNTEFWNGYAGQKCLVLDDAFQARPDPTDKDNEYMSLIRMIGSWSFPLNFADLASKGRIFFNSRLVFATTNQTSVVNDAAQVLNCPSAVVRRLKYSYVLELDPAFSKDGRLDSDAFELELAACSAKTGLDGYPWHVWTFRKHDFGTGLTTGPHIPVIDVIRQIANDLQARTATHEGERSFIDSFISKLTQPDGEIQVQIGGEGEIQPGPVRPPVPRSAASVLEYDETSDPEVLADRIVNDVRAFRAERAPDDQSPMLPCGLTARDLQRSLAKERKHWREQHPGQSYRETYRRLERKAGPFKGVYDPTRHLNGDPADSDYSDSTLTNFSDNLSSYFNELFQAHKVVKKAISGALFTIGAVLVFKLLKPILDGFWGFLKSLFGGNKVAQSNRKLAATDSTRGPKAGLIPHSGDPSVCERVYANTYKVYVRHDDNYEVMGQVIFIMDTLAMQPSHFTEVLSAKVKSGQVFPTDKMFFRHAVNSCHSFDMCVSDYLSLRRLTRRDDDVEFFVMPQVRSHRKVLNYITEKDLPYIRGAPVRLDVCDISDFINQSSGCMRIKYVCTSAQVGTDLHYSQRKLLRFVRYFAGTSPGDCGAPLCLDDNSRYSGRTIIGFHVCGDSSRCIGYSTIITREMVDAAITEFKTIVDNFEEDLASRGIELQTGMDGPLSDFGSFLPIGTIDKTVPICPKSCFYKTKDYGLLGDYDCYPAALSPKMIDGVRVYPMIKALTPYASPVKIHTYPWMRQVFHVAMYKLEEETKNSSRHIYSFSEAVLGIPQEKFRSIPRGTSAGFPYIFDVRNGKKDFFGSAMDYDLTGPLCVELENRVEHIISSAKKGIRLSHIFVDFLKDELRPLSKVESCATRLISAAPLDYTIAWRRLFGAFSAACMKHHTRSGMAPGICVYTDWEELARLLTSKNGGVFAGDFKAFDASEQPTVHRLMLDYINKWYDDGPENALAREVLWCDLVHSRHVGGNGMNQCYVYQWNKSLPSGHPFTTICNSMYSLFLLVAAYCHKTGDFVNFWEYVAAITYGDDNVSCVSADVASQFNQVTVASSLFELFGVTYTSDDKGADLKPITHLGDVTFLKRGFSDRLFDGQEVCLCPLALDSFLYTFYWCKNHRLEDRIRVDVLETSLEELSMHSNATWLKYAPKLYALLSESALPKAPCEQEDYLRIIRSRSDNWY